MFGVGAEISPAPTDAWEAAKREAICAMVRAGRDGDLIFYSDLSRQISSLRIEPHSYEMDRLLDQISKEEEADGRGILTALVVLKDEGIPAPGFWVSAAELGRDVNDRIGCWAQEVKRVLEECPRHPLCP
jgi:hypothetical protein